MLRSCEAFGVTSALLVHAQRGEGETEAANPDPNPTTLPLPLPLPLIPTLSLVEP